jgi:hypothetical protein
MEKNFKLKEYGRTGRKGIYGSYVAGTKLVTDDPEALQSLPAWDKGLEAATTQGDMLPILEEENAKINVITRKLNIVSQDACCEWLANETYRKYAKTWKVNGRGDRKEYISLVDNNTNKDPTLTTGFWEVYSASGGGGGGGGGNDAFGTLGYTLSPIPPSNCLMCNGLTLNEASFILPQFIPYLLKNYIQIPADVDVSLDYMTDWHDNNPGKTPYLSTIEQYNTVMSYARNRFDNTTINNCGYFMYNQANDVLRIPKMDGGMFLRTKAQPGKYFQDQIVNVATRLYMGGNNGTSEWDPCNGFGVENNSIFYNPTISSLSKRITFNAWGQEWNSYASGNIYNTTNTGISSVRFDLSRQITTGDTVKPRSFDAPLYVYVGTISNNITYNIYAEDLPVTLEPLNKYKYISDLPAKLYLTIQQGENIKLYKNGTTSTYTGNTTINLVNNDLFYIVSQTGTPYNKVDVEILPFNNITLNSPFSLQIGKSYEINSIINDLFVKNLSTTQTATIFYNRQIRMLPPNTQLNIKKGDLIAIVGGTVNNYVIDRKVTIITTGIKLTPNTYYNNSSFSVLLKNKNEVNITLYVNGTARTVNANDELELPVNTVLMMSSIVDNVTVEQNNIVYIEQNDLLVNDVSLKTGEFYKVEKRVQHIELVISSVAPNDLQNAYWLPSSSTGTPPTNFPLNVKRYNYETSQWVNDVYTPLLQDVVSNRNAPTVKLYVYTSTGWSETSYLFDYNLTIQNNTQYAAVVLLDGVTQQLIAGGTLDVQPDVLITVIENGEVHNDNDYVLTIKTVTFNDSMLPLYNFESLTQYKYQGAGAKLVEHNIQMSTIIYNNGTLYNIDINNNMPITNNYIFTVIRYGEDLECVIQ